MFPVSLLARCLVVLACVLLPTVVWTQPAISAEDWKTTETVQARRAEFLASYLRALKTLPKVERCEVINRSRPIFGTWVPSGKHRAETMDAYDSLYFEAEAQYYFQILAVTAPDVADPFCKDMARELVTYFGITYPDFNEADVDWVRADSENGGKFSRSRSLLGMEINPKRCRYYLYVPDGWILAKAAGILVSKEGELLELNPEEVIRLVWVCEYSSSASLVEPSTGLLRKSLSFAGSDDEKVEIIKEYLASQSFCGSAWLVGEGLWLGGLELRPLAIEACDQLLREERGNECFITKVKDKVMKGGVTQID